MEPAASSTLMCKITNLCHSYRLNGLTVASRVHILEPQWNPAVESQAIGRVLRVDQDRQVTVIRYAMRKSIEDVSIPYIELVYKLR